MRKLLGKHSRYNIKGHQIITFALIGEGEGVKQNASTSEHRGRGQGYVNVKANTFF